jgi:hypothetical protein
MGGLAEMGGEAAWERKVGEVLVGVAGRMVREAEQVREKEVVRIRKRQMGRLKLMFSLFAGQFLAMHYCIYFALSWDIM